MSDIQSVTSNGNEEAVASSLRWRLGVSALLALTLSLPALSQPAAKWIETLSVPNQTTWTVGPSHAQRVLSSGEIMVVGQSGSLSFSTVIDSAGITVGGAKFPFYSYAAAIGPFGEVFLVTGSGGMSVGKYDGFTGRPMWNSLAFPATSPSVTIVKVVLDLRGNVIILAVQDNDLVVAKVDGLSGTVLWTWLPVSAEHDTPKDVVIDAYGDVVVLVGTGFEFTTTKLSGQTGLPLWADRFDSPNAWFEQPCSVNLDSAGYILVAGSNADGVLALKYSSAGSRIWTRSHVPSSGPAGAYTATVDGSDDLVVAAAASGQWVVVKFHGASGGVLWDSAAAVAESRLPIAVRTDGNGDVFVMGDDDSPYASSTEASILRCEGDTGAVGWLQEVSMVNVRQFSLDGAGRLLVSGLHLDFGYGIVTRALDPSSGAQLWNHETYAYADASTYAYASECDAAGSVVVGRGYSEGWNVERLDADGNVLWSFTKPSGYNWGWLADVAIDPAGDVLVAVTETYSWPDRISVYKLDGGTGAQLWEAHWDRGIYNYESSVSDLAVDAAGNVYVVGTTGDSYTPGSMDLVVLSFDSAGTLRWTSPFDTSVDDVGDRLTIDSAGSLFVIGQYGADALVRKVSTTDGSTVWSTTHRPDPLGYSAARLIASFGASHLAIAGFTGNSSDFIMRVRSSDGLIEWDSVEASSNLYPRALIFDLAGNPISAAESPEVSKTRKFDAASGTPIWTYEGPSSGASYDHALLLTADGAGVLLAGYSNDQGGAPERKTHITRISAADGLLEWGPIQYELSVGNDYARALHSFGADTFMVGEAGNASFVMRLSGSLGIDVMAASPPIGYCGDSYSHALVGRNGTPPYSWSVIAGAIPPGLNLSSSGTISGTPTLAGHYGFTVRLTDGVATDDKEISIDVIGGDPYELVFASPHPVCLGTATTLSLSNAFASYEWAPGGETTPTLSVSPSHPALYGVTVGADYSCENRGAFEVAVIPPISGTHIRVEGSTLICPDGSTNALIAVNHGGGPASYEWSYRTTPGGTATPIPYATSARYVVNAADFPASGTYYLLYSTWPNCGTSFTSDEIAITLVEFGSATGLAAEATAESQITLTWVAATGLSVDHYNIYRANGLCPASGFAKVGETVGTETSWNDGAVTPGSTYSYKVSAASAGNQCESLETACRSSVPYGTCSLAPSFAGATTVTSSACGLRVAWATATSQCPTARGIVYSVYRSTSSTFIPDATNRIASCVATLFYDDRTVAEGTTYYYVVRAEDATSHGTGACNHGNEDGNLARRSGMPIAMVTADSTLLSDNFEPGQRPVDAATLWYEELLAGVDQLSIVACKSAGAGTLSYKFGQVGTCGTYYAPSTSNRLTLGGSPYAVGTGIALPSGTGLRLRFRHAVELNTYSDLATLYYKTDLMGSFAIVGTSAGGDIPFITQGAYNATIGGTPVWNGSSIPDFSEVWVNIDSLAGRTVWFQWRFTSGSSAYYEGYYLDDVVLETTTVAPCDSDPPPVTALGAVARGDYSYIYWMNPQSSSYASTMIRSNSSFDGSGTFPALPTDGYHRGTVAGTAGQRGTLTHWRVSSTWTFRYSAFVHDGVSKYSAPRGVLVRAVPAFPVRWAYSTGASATTPPGILGGVGGTSFVVSNDRVFHSLRNGPVAGDWPTSWTPPVFDAPSQSRTLPLQLPIGGSPRKVVLAGTQDGYVHCVDATTGAVIWTSVQLGDVVQGSPTAISTVYGAPFSLVLAGARTTSGVGRVYGLDPENGEIRWTFENLVSQGGDGAAVGAVNDAINFDYADAGGGMRRAWFGSRRNPSGSSDTFWGLLFDGSSVSKSWSRDVGPIDGFPMLGGGTLYAGTNSSHVWAVNAATGAPVWASPFHASDGPVKVTVWPDTTNSRIYFSTTNHVWSVGTDGTVKWQKQLTAPTTPNRTTAGLLVGAGDGRIYQLSNLIVTDPAALTVKSVLLRGGTYVGAATVDKTNGLLYVGTSEGMVYAMSFPIP